MKNGAVVPKVIAIGSRSVSVTSATIQRDALRFVTLWQCVPNPDKKRQWAALLAEMGEPELTIRNYLRHSNLHVANKYL